MHFCLVFQSRSAERSESDRKEREAALLLLESRNTFHSPSVICFQLSIFIMLILFIVVIYLIALIAFLQMYPNVIFFVIVFPIIIVIHDYFFEYFYVYKCFAHSAVAVTGPQHEIRRLCTTFP